MTIDMDDLKTVWQEDVQNAPDPAFIDALVKQTRRRNRMTWFTVGLELLMLSGLLAILVYLIITANDWRVGSLWSLCALVLIGCRIDRRICGDVVPRRGGCHRYIAAWYHCIGGGSLPDILSFLDWPAASRIRRGPGYRARTGLANTVFSCATKHSGWVPEPIPLPSLMRDLASSRIIWRRICRSVALTRAAWAAISGQGFLPRTRHIYASELIVMSWPSVSAIGRA